MSYSQRELTYRSANCTANFSDEQNGGGNHSNIDMRDGCLRANLLADGRKAATQPLKNLRPNKFRRSSFSLERSGNFHITATYEALAPLL